MLKFPGTFVWIRSNKVLNIYWNAILFKLHSAIHTWNSSKTPHLVESLANEKFVFSIQFLWIFISLAWFYITRNVPIIAVVSQFDASKQVTIWWVYLVKTLCCLHMCTYRRMVCVTSKIVFQNIHRRCRFCQRKANKHCALFTCIGNNFDILFVFWLFAWVLLQSRCHYSVSVYVMMLCSFNWVEFVSNEWRTKQ